MSCWRVVSDFIGGHDVDVTKVGLGVALASFRTISEEESWGAFQVVVLVWTLGVGVRGRISSETTIEMLPAGAEVVY
jgi:hypothetical protein